MAKTPDIETHAELRPDDEAVVVQGLAAANQAAGPFDSIVPIRCFARADDGSIVGGAIGQVWGTCAELGQLWVAEDARRAGLGSRLLSAFEAEVAARGCIVCVLDTFSFQNLRFYLDRGYATACRFDGFPDDNSYYVMSKQLGSD